jgi:hypothetical protein
MFKSVLVLVATAASGAALAQTSTATAGNWTLEAAPNGCVVHAASPSGTVVSIWGLAGESSLSFLVQNQRWNSFADGQRYDIRVSFEKGRTFPMKAVARRNIDRDGPGLTFPISPAPAGGASFLEQFAAADGMHITRNDEVETVRLVNTDVALRGLAKCLRQVWAISALRESDEAAPTTSAAVPDTI